MKTLYLHIGMPRTATTVLQKFCADNQEELNHHGYCYPLMPFQYPNANPRRTAHFMFGWAKNEKGIRDVELEKRYWIEGFSEVYHAFEKYDNVILSDEGLWNCGFRNKESAWSKLKKEMEVHAFRTKVIVYLRRQDDFLYSWWNQRIKEGLYGECTLSWEEMTKKLPIVHLDYFEMLNQIAEFVGKENMIIRRFGKEYFDGNTVYEDFIHAIGLQYTDAYQIQTEVFNRGLTKNNAELKRILNKLPDLDAQSNRMFQHILAHNSNCKGDNPKYSMYSQSEANELYEKYREGNQLIAKEYMGKDGDLFPFQYNAEQKWTLQNEEMLEDIILFMGTSLMEMERKIKTQEQEIKAQKKELEDFKRKVAHPVRTIVKRIKNRLKLTKDINTDG